MNIKQTFPASIIGDGVDEWIVFRLLSANICLGKADPRVRLAALLGFSLDLEIASGCEVLVDLVLGGSELFGRSVDCVGLTWVLVGLVTRCETFVQEDVLGIVLGNDVDTWALPFPFRFHIY